ncbi:MAG TPA: ATP-binding protein, partial [Bacteroidetes bacterium]|nr:ATP-binding protein [Bacteroidota bacterium]
MAYKRFTWHVVFRVVLLFGFLSTLSYVLLATDWVATAIVVGIACILVTTDLIRYVNKTNRDLAAFLQSIQHHDFTASFSSGNRGPSFDALKDAFNGIIREFRTLELEKESHYHYLQTVIEHIGVALICFDADGEVMLMNQAAKGLLAKPYIKRIGALEKVDENLMTTIRKLHSGERALIKLLIQDDLRQVAIQATEFKLMGVSYKLLSLQDIRSELDGREMEAWQKLIRVLTHEIMNSITPVSTLSGVLGSLVRDDSKELKAAKNITEEDLEDLSVGLAAIESRSRGLLKFVRAYRSLLKVPKPVFREVVVQDLLLRIKTLLQPDLEARGIQIELKVPRTELMIHADPDLIEQVLINLIKNAMEALAGQKAGCITIVAALRKEQETIVQVKDNGTGIEKEFVDQIFVPFF